MSSLCKKHDWQEIHLPLWSATKGQLVDIGTKILEAEEYIIMLPIWGKQSRKILHRQMNWREKERVNWKLHVIVLSENKKIMSEVWS
jgi:hypothetical protein